MLNLNVGVAESKNRFVLKSVEQFFFARNSGKLVRLRFRFFFASAMSGTTLIRVKRRRSQSPAEALLVHLAPKRARADGSGDSNPGKRVASPGTEPRAKIFRFAATLTDPEKASDEKKLVEFVGSKVKLETPAKSAKNARASVKVFLYSSHQYSVLNPESILLG